MPEKNTESSFAQRLLAWFDRFGRHDLPWQSDKSPYRVWVSEIMLQQTQVKTVVGYYQRFMQAFPDVWALAEADQETVLSYWAGLGYYARGRNLHKAARQLVQEHNGRFPQTLEGLIALPGIGRSTASAILAISHNQRLPILDGNVKRVLARFDAVATWPGEKATENALWQRADQLMQTDRPGDYTQAIMDLGATVCTRSQPSCDACPFRSDCRACLTGQVATLPKRKPKKSKPTRHAIVWLWRLQGTHKIWLVRRPQQGIWGGLWSLPEVRLEETVSSQEALQQRQTLIKSRVESLPVAASDLIEWETFQHTFSHYHLMITPVALTLNQAPQEDGQWLSVEEALARGLPAPIQKVVQRVSLQGT
ncbi:A/G-specific adenine glycosylase [Hydrogenovibrio halophilus]|uniref:A/G-specific adenine glycosylase n=1 Tax=Hydrogenovibrio halophilus TaxID=373391 RepID=UPI00037BA89E|nr:A/G-specific adenine glycosylase [Hydrogenovibrio halophilus]